MLFAAIAALAGCAAPPVASNETADLPFDQAVTLVTDNLVKQTQNMPAFLAKLAKRGVVVDPMLDAASGQQTAATRLLEQRVTDRMRNDYAVFDMLPFDTASLAKAQYLLTGTMKRDQSSKTGVFQLNLALTDIKTGNVVAQSSARARDDGLDTSPTPYYRDSPILVKDKVVDGYIRTCETPPGQPADPVYFQRVSTATMISDATASYDTERYTEALGKYQNALSTPSGEQIRVFNGIYLSTWKLGKVAEAEQAFAKVVAFGIANNSLGVKFLFNPNSTVFWSDPQVSGPYDLWVRQIARQASAAKVCMDVVGHTSRTGSEPYNDKLSLSRAAYIKQRLEAESKELIARTKSQGMGFHQNIVGTGTDDVRDALDRRVEFKIVPCP
ncbi:MAG: OmpA family protein [Sterolibacteriaceae bacterium]|uniref:OmpA family protein n=1 Tax=Candidatus Methylophosphatis roskildensis TaxID=2899263 RepID=A0A9D7E012_9PROT|nr:OmpA family protein [Candidatus Methylophosphatis roskildensis]MBK7234262.1 OmpA family protein [Sterolibacteriaceae bacterium]MBK7662405.1 OmpA family protein [Sterolibacteriaceae bacterium]MBK9086520.1 OmpA family protein [Sterolibacteriaceae bacterium]